MTTPARTILVLVLLALAMSGPVRSDVLSGTGDAQVYPPSVAKPTPVASTAMVITQTTVSLAAGVSAQLIGSNPARKSLRWMVAGTGAVTVVPGGAAAVVGAGINYGAGAGVGQQGGSESFEGLAVPTNAFQAISAAGTTVTVWEGQ